MNKLNVLLLEAASRGDFDEVILLLESGAEINAVDPRGKSVIDYAKEFNSSTLAAYFEGLKVARLSSVESQFAAKTEPAADPFAARAGAGAGAGSVGFVPAGNDAKRLRTDEETALLRHSRADLYKDTAGESVDTIDKTYNRTMDVRNKKRSNASMASEETKLHNDYSTRSSTLTMTFDGSETESKDDYITRASTIPQRKVNLTEPASLASAGVFQEDYNPDQDIRAQKRALAFTAATERKKLLNKQAQAPQATSDTMSSTEEVFDDRADLIRKNIPEEVINLYLDELAAGNPTSLESCAKELYKKFFGFSDRVINDYVDNFMGKHNTETGSGFKITDVAKFHIEGKAVELPVSALKSGEAEVRAAPEVQYKVASSGRAGFPDSGSFADKFDYWLRNVNIEVFRMWVNSLGVDDIINLNSLLRQEKYADLNSSIKAISDAALENIMPLRDEVNFINEQASAELDQLNRRRFLMEPTQRPLPTRIAGASDEKPKITKEQLDSNSLSMLKHKQLLLRKYGVMSVYEYMKKQYDPDTHAFRPVKASDLSILTPLSKAPAYEIYPIAAERSAAPVRNLGDIVRGEEFRGAVSVLSSKGVSAAGQATTTLPHSAPGLDRSGENASKKQGKGPGL